MKIPFLNFGRKDRVSESASAGSPKTGGQSITGRVITTPRAMPEHAAVLREVAEHNRKQVRMYDAAVTNNLNADFIPTVGSANAEIQTSLYVARGRSRTLCKDFPTAKGILRTFKNNVVGDDPFRLDMKIGHWQGTGDSKTFKLDEDLNRLIEEAWDDARKPENLTVRGDMGYMEMCQMVESSALRDGSILARMHRDFPHNKYNFALEFIEVDRLQESYNGSAPETGNAIRFSIERDKWNRPVAYWILNRHPGDLFQYNGFSPKILREAVPAEEIIHFNNLRDRAEQDIGFPEFDAVMQTLHRNRQFDVAHVTAAIWSCCKPFWIKQEFPTGMPYAGDPSLMFNSVAPGVQGASTNEGGYGDGKGGGANKVKVLEPGTGEILNYGQTPIQLDPRFPIEAAGGFRKDNHMDVASGVGLSYGSVSSDFQNYSFSVARFATLPERDNFKVRQEKMICDFVRKHFCNWLKNAIMSGALALPLSRFEEFCNAATFHGKRWPYIQPVQDAQADIMRIEAVLASRSEILADSEKGRKFIEVASEQAEEDSVAEAHDIDLHQEVTIATIKKGEPGEPQPDPDGEPAPTPKKNEKAKAKANKKTR